MDAVERLAQTMSGRRVRLTVRRPNGELIAECDALWSPFYGFRGGPIEIAAIGANGLFGTHDLQVMPPYTVSVEVVEVVDG